MAGEGNAGSELRAAWESLRQSASEAWKEAVHNTVHFGRDTTMSRDMLVRILGSMSHVAQKGYEWEEQSTDRPRHAVQLRRLAVLSSNLDSLARLAAGESVDVSDGDILSVMDPGEGEDTPEQRNAPRAGSKITEAEREAMATVYVKIQQIRIKINREVSAAEVELRQPHFDVDAIVEDINQILAYIRENN